MDEAQVIPTQANDERERIRRAYRAALDVLAKLTADSAPHLDKIGPAASSSREADLAAAAERVRRIGTLLAAADRDLEAIERSVLDRGPRPVRALGLCEGWLIASNAYARAPCDGRDLVHSVIPGATLPGP